MLQKAVSPGLRKATVAARCMSKVLPVHWKSRKLAPAGPGSPQLVEGRMSKVFENKVTSAGSAKLSVDGKDVDLPIVVGTEKERALDISKLRAKTGCITHDEAFMNTGSTTSAITFLDG